MAANWVECECLLRSGVNDKQKGVNGKSGNYLTTINLKRQYC
jgi:hypothetical protein